MNEYTPRTIMVDACLVYGLRDPAPISSPQIETRARAAVLAHQRYTQLNNPYLWDGSYGQAPQPSDTELITYRHTQDQLWLQSTVAVAAFHQQTGTPENVQAGAHLMEQITHSLSSESPATVKDLLGDFYLDWLTGGSDLIHHYLATNQLAPATAIAAILEPHLDVTEEFNQLRLNLEQLRSRLSGTEFAHLALPTIRAIAAT